MPIEAYNQWRGWADPKVCSDYALSMAITSWNDEISREMELLTGPEYGRLLFLMINSLLTRHKFVQIFPCI
jgi:dihydroorotase-like cyclic amidohydrolase